jgi:hypothetical protein
VRSWATPSQKPGEKALAGAEVFTVSPKVPSRLVSKSTLSPSSGSDCVPMKAPT